MNECIKVEILKTCFKVSSNVDFLCILVAILPYSVVAQIVCCG